MSKINKKELHEIFQDLRDKNKNQSAYNKLYEKYYNLIYGIVFSIIKNKADSEDVTHEIFTKIYKLDVNKLPTENEASWLFTVSKNECMMFFRKSRPNISIDEIYEMPATSNEVDNVIDREYYNKLMSGLKEDEKMIVSLKVLSNFTFNKISKVMGIPIGTVQWKYYNSINSLKISISSLAGAVLAFIIVIARGDFWKKGEYLNKAEEGRKDTEDKKESIDESSQFASESKNATEINNEEINQGTTDFSDSEIKEAEKNTGDNNQVTENEMQIVEVAETADNTGKILSSDDKIQVGFLSLGIVFLIIFIIFFKKYQQKLKIKTSK